MLPWKLCTYFAIAAGCLSALTATASRADAGALGGVTTAAEATSSNWSGYVAGGGGYASISGAFNVAKVARYVAGSSASEWVGLDGWSNSTLIQAGVDELPVGPGETIYEPWWEIVPGPQHLATGIMVRPGDRVSVTLKRVGQAVWSIAISDLSNGDSFSTRQPYYGAAVSAEWIVEACSHDGGQLTTLAPLARRVVFTAMTVASAETAARDDSGTTQFTPVVMVQEGRTVSVPSSLSRGSFSVSYPL